MKVTEIFCSLVFLSFLSDASLAQTEIEQTQKKTEICEGQGKGVGNKGRIDGCECHINRVIYTPGNPSNPCLKEFNKKKSEVPSPQPPVEDCDTEPLNSSGIIVKTVEPIIKKVEEEQKLKFTQSKNAEELPIPQLTANQIDELFSRDSKLQFDITWEKGSGSVKAKGSEDTKFFHELASHKLFSLAFADLYLMDREKLEKEATKILASDETFQVKIYFRRFEDVLDNFGNPKVNLTEKKCLDWFRKGAKRRGRHRTSYLHCAPAIQLDMQLKKNDTVVNSVRVSKITQELFGPGTGRTITGPDNIIEAMKKLKP